MGAHKAAFAAVKEKDALCIAAEQVIGGAIADIAPRTVKIIIPPDRHQAVQLHIRINHQTIAEDGKEIIGQNHLAGILAIRHQPCEAVCRLLRQ